MEGLLPKCDKIRERFDKTLRDIESKGFSIDQEPYPYVMKHIESGKTRKIFAMDFNDNVDELIEMFWDDSGGSEALGGIASDRMPGMMNKMFNDIKEQTGSEVKVESTSHTTIPNACPECGGDIHDGTGTGWMVCKKCTWMG